MKKEQQNIHIGKLIQEELRKSGMSKKEFARRIETSSQNVYGIFKRETIDTGTLLIISKVLQFDFFLLYENEYFKSILKKKQVDLTKQITGRNKR